mmetsp:Transcript_14503/g.54788  ORF Transcript_14503/g.54788 Transcript_14503/m.54788 type:complete len:216 (-) Transcript_14503:849-1496(-)
MQVHVRIHSRRHVHPGEERGLYRVVHVLSKLVSHLEIGVQAENLRFHRGLDHEWKREDRAHRAKVIKERRGLRIGCIFLLLRFGRRILSLGSLRRLELLLGTLQLVDGITSPVLVLALQNRGGPHHLVVHRVTVECGPGQESSSLHLRRSASAGDSLLLLKPRNVEDVVRKRPWSTAPIRREKHAQDADGIQHGLDILLRLRSREARREVRDLWL